MIRTVLRKARAKVIVAVNPLFSFLFPKKWKSINELKFWKNIRNTRRWQNYYYHYYFTTEFGLWSIDYGNKKILDIGCGPLGSLEWANMASCRVGLDCLANRYKKWTMNHKMEYVNAYSESIPFENNTFDVVSSFNSLDHVNDLGQTIDEIKRVLKPGGLFLLLVDCNHKSRACEPQAIPIDIAIKFFPEFVVESKCFYKKHELGLYQSVLGEKFLNVDLKFNEEFVAAIKFRAR